jgi:hypothetical protein
MPEIEPTTNPDGSTNSPSSTAPTSGSPEPWRAGGHSRFAGRSAEEVLGIAETLASVAEKFNQPLPAPAPPVNRFDLDLPDDDYLTGKQVKNVLYQLASQRPVSDPVATARNAKTSWELLQIKRPKEFKRWGREIYAEAQRLPVENWDVDNLSIIVDIVSGRHVHELAAEEAQRLVDESHPTIRSGTGGSGGGPYTQQISVEAEGVPKAWATAAKAAGITEAEVREFCATVGITPEQYMADLVKYGKGAVIRG